MDDHQSGETLEQGLGSPPSASPLGGGAEIAAMAFDLHLSSRWAITLLGALTTLTVPVAHAIHLA